MLAPVTRLKKAEINRLARWRCKHKHTGITHYNCWIKENPDSDRVAIFDIETSHLKANWGIILAWCLKPYGEKKIISRVITKKELHTCLDKILIKECIKELRNFDTVVTYNGSYFDIPWVRSRALHYGLRFLQYGELNTVDVYRSIVKHKINLHSRRQGVVCEFLFGETEKTHLRPEIFLRALQGKKESLAWILDHCQRDVRDLERIYDKVIDFKRKSDTSI